MRPTTPAPILLTLLLAASAAAQTPERGRVELRPVIGTVAGADGPFPSSQLQIGLEGSYALSAPLALVVGGWGGVAAKDFVSFGVHAGVKYRLLGLNPVAFPFVAAGAGFDFGFPSGQDVLGGFVVRAGGGVDLKVSERIFPGLQVMFEVGPKFLPGAGVLGTAQVTLGCSFVL
jgi:hypothetical protein